MARKKTYDEIKKEIEEKGLELISKEYINSITPLKVKCRCGNIFERNYKTIRKPQSLALCKECIEPIRRERGRCFQKKDVEEIMSKYGLELVTKFEDIKGVKQGLDVICKCGKPFRPTLFNLKKGESTMCWSCASFLQAIHKKHSLESVREIVENYGGTLLSKEYKDNKTDLEIRCNCGNIHWRRLNSILTYESSKCDLCKNRNSKGEIKVAEILKENNIYFETQKTFADCRYIGVLRFDFYLPQINTIIEYDGEQHFRPVEIWGGQEEFELVKKRDKIKNNYCASKNICLIRISYENQKNIEETLRENKIIPSQAC